MADEHTLPLSKFHEALMTRRFTGITKMSGIDVTGCDFSSLERLYKFTNFRSKGCKVIADVELVGEAVLERVRETEGAK